VAGRIPVAIPILIITWLAKRVEIPAAKREPNLSLAWRLVSIARKMRKR